jgi:hypothetical protein
MTNPFIVDPSNYDKFVAIRDAAHYVEDFLDHNGYPHVKQYLLAPDPSKAPPGKNPWHNNGWYWHGILFVNLSKSRTPVKSPGFCWSFTGFKADLTAPGILAHETGHHIHAEINNAIDTKHARIMLDCLRLIAKQEVAVSGYEPNAHEIFAEMTRLFILNPKLLQEGRPLRYKFLLGCGLKPIHDTPWRDVLKYAHPRMISAAESWIRRGIRCRKTNNS